MALSIFKRHISKLSCTIHVLREQKAYGAFTYGDRLNITGQKTKIYEARKN